jgi:hypothetical protein
VKLWPLPALPIDRAGRMLALGITLVVPLVLWGAVAAPLLAWHAERDAALAQRRELARHMEELVAGIPELERRASHGESNEDADLLFAGDTDAIAAAALQERVQAIAAASGAAMTSAEMLPAQQLSGVRRIGLRVAVYVRTWSGVAHLLQGLEQATPKMLVSDLEIRGMPSAETTSDTPTAVRVTILAYRPAQ